MAIAGAMKVAGKALGKAVKVIKKKKKELEKTKAGKKVKQTIKKVKANPKVKKATEKLGTAAKVTGGVAGGLVGAGLGATTAVGTVAGTLAGPTIGKAVRASKKVIDKARGKKVKIDPKDKKKSTIFGENTSENQISDMLTGAVAGGALGLGAGVGGLGLMAASLFKSNSSPEQEYTQSRLADGRISTVFGGKEKNSVFSKKHLSAKQIDEVRSHVAILESIIQSNDPRARRDQFINTILKLHKEYGINNISGKNLSIFLPDIPEGKRKKINIASDVKNFF